MYTREKMLQCTSGLGGAGFQEWTNVHLCLNPSYVRHGNILRQSSGSGPPPLNSLTFRSVVGQLSEVVPFLLLKQRCGMAWQAMLRRTRRCRCSRKG